MEKQTPLSLGHPWQDDEPFSVGPTDSAATKTSIAIDPDLKLSLGQSQSVASMAEELKKSIRNDRKYRSSKK